MPAGWFSPCPQARVNHLLGRHIAGAATSTFPVLALPALRRDRLNRLSAFINQCHSESQILFTPLVNDVANWDCADSL